MIEIYDYNTFKFTLNKIVNCDNKLMEFLYYKEVLQEITGKMVSIVHVVKSNVTEIYFRYL